jgi:hypothetical protein
VRPARDCIHLRTRARTMPLRSVDPRGLHVAKHHGRHSSIPPPPPTASRLQSRQVSRPARALFGDFANSLLDE